jgi:hypothetical protein
LSKILCDRRLASIVVSPSASDISGGLKAHVETAQTPAGRRRAQGRGADRRRSAAELLAAIARGLAATREPRGVRERFEEELRSIVRARSVAVCDGALVGTPPPNMMCFEIPTVVPSQRARIEVAFDPGRTLDGWTCQVLEGAAHLAALLLEIERAHGRPPQFARLRDGAAPIIGSSQAIRLVRHRIEQAAAVEYTFLVERESGPQPRPGFIEVFGEAAVRDCDGGGSDGGWALAGSVRRRSTSSFEGVSASCLRFITTRQQRAPPSKRARFSGVVQVTSYGHHSRNRIQDPVLHDRCSRRFDRKFRRPFERLEGGAVDRWGGIPCGPSGAS